jgi:hypothetical protein
MQMTRSTLVEIVRGAAAHAQYDEDTANRIVAAVSDPSITRVARGDWFAADGAECPLCLAGIAYNDEAAGAQECRFYHEFDFRTRLTLKGRGVPVGNVIEVIDG